VRAANSEHDLAFAHSDGRNGEREKEDPANPKIRQTTSRRGVSAMQGNVFQEIIRHRTSGGGRKNGHRGVLTDLFRKKGKLLRIEMGAARGDVTRRQWSRPNTGGQDRGERLRRGVVYNRQPKTGDQVSKGTGVQGQLRPEGE